MQPLRTTRVPLERDRRLLAPLRLAVRNLTKRKARTALTTLGVTLAIAFTVGLLSLSEGLMVTIEMEVRKFGIDIFIWKKGMETVFLPGMVTYAFPEDRADGISRVENVRTAVPGLEAIVLRGEGFPLIVEGMPPSSFSEFKPYATLEAGRFLNDSDTHSLLLGHAAATATNSSVSATIDIMGKRFTVVGVLEKAGDMFDSVGFAPLGSLQEATGQQGKVNWVMVKVNDPSRAEETATLIEAIYEDLTAATMDEALEFTKQLLGIARGMHLSISSVSLLIGVLFVFATMLISVSERVREIGTMRAIGASRLYIFALIVTESLAISAVGGTVGCVGGYLLSRVINWLIASSVGITFVQTAVTPGLVATGMTVALAIGTIAGLYPAWGASRLDIVEALRHE